ncbi:helix-turn-helix transcriptional regulator [Rhizobium sp. WYCCWR 11152]|nr:helix-turn-helix transcriptional regulator [Rhizobium sp. WYCCWR 11152]
MKGGDLKRWREERGQTQKELAEELDVSRHSILKWEGATTVPRIVELAILGLQNGSAMIGKTSSASEIAAQQARLDAILTKQL